jgi:trans-2,3-dihydro-3-hydroxyanthranilate isomerase
MRIPFRLVDVFTDRPLAGNQLCVVPEPVPGISTERMQAVAREIGFSETTFVTSFEPDRYAMRIFTPANELPFAGHPSIGTAFVLVSEGRVRSPLTQVVAAGEFDMSVDVEAGTARMRQLAPEFFEPLGPAGRRALAESVRLDPDQDLVADLPVQKVSTGFGHLNMAVRDVATVVKASLDRSALIRQLEAAGTDGVYVFAMTGSSPEKGSTAKARLFAPVAGVDEDPATGSAAGPLGAFLVHHGVIPSGRLTISQGEELGRPSTLVVDVEQSGDGDLAVYVEGGVRIVGEGWFDLPD